MCLEVKSLAINVSNIHPSSSYFLEVSLVTLSNETGLKSSSGCSVKFCSKNSIEVLPVGSSERFGNEPGSRFRAPLVLCLGLNSKGKTILCELNLSSHKVAGEGS